MIEFCTHEKHGGVCDLTDDYCNLVDCPYEKLQEFVPVRHGRWISWEEAGNPVSSPDRHECSVCHDAAQVLVNHFELLSEYCPNCGAKMDGAE